MNGYRQDDEELRRRAQLILQVTIWLTRHPFDVLMAIGVALYLIWRLW
jgi:hypothetical protein